ncbi:N-acyl-D-amino-acid deacylase family protein [Achromobacter aloeverae]|uniref:D-aminoacylase n=1 Tax=Achromobacter aloeverae TaxID=1750518 RepID=A0A4Q1HDW6_9BURK|nr:D-aminoacylase [Achromobacter aloeverae]RXN84425.1 D-aminoacylase [Achromobacter aloeverae]
MDTQQPYDLILQGGDVVDGTGAPRRRADVGIRGGRIAAIGDLASAPVRPQGRMDVTGLVVAPGFIDCHSHDDWAVLEMPDMAPKVSQGVTTVINGNCGISLAPLQSEELPPPPLNLLGGGYRFGSFAEYRAAIDARPPAVNVAAMVGHSTLRVRHMPDLDTPADAAQIAAMRADVEQALREGALGVSTGTFYPPAAAATEAEIIAVCEPLSRLGGVYATHMRDEGNHVMDAIDESLRIGAALNVPLVISHHKLVGKQNHGRSAQTLEHVRAAAARQAVCMDCYPYDASSTMLRPERVEICDRIMITWSKPFPQASGRYLEDLADEWGCSRREAAERLLPGGAVYFIMDDNDVRRILAYQDTMIGSDGLAADARPHPRLWGTFPRVLGHYARGLGVFSLEEAVFRMSGLTALRFGLRERGQVAVGFHADLAVFDPATIIDRATFDEPETPCEGMRHVYVGGVATWADGAPTGARPGRYIAERIGRSA